ncbi:MAG: hypothetical protein QNJ16_08480 [Rhodobacter sp.]|nr:hypothetical protein [Rhodobacter sp.]
MAIKPLILSAVAALALAGCGDTVTEQSLIGAGAGAGTAAMLDGNLALGAIVGAGANVAYCNQYPDRC